MQRTHHTLDQSSLALFNQELFQILVLSSTAFFAAQSTGSTPNNVSSILYYWASLIIHDLFQTDHHDFSNSQTSSYLDLSTLYGDDQKDQDNIRTFKDGKLKPDCFSEQRVMGMPPACGIIL